MNRLKFSEGGQPIYLEDLQLLQDNEKSSAGQVLSALCCGRSTMLFEKPTYQYTENEAGDFVIKVSQGTAFINGDFVSWRDAVIVGPQSEDDLWLCVREIPGDKRTFDDGQLRSCMVSREGYISADPAGAVVSYKLNSLRCIADYIQELIGYKIAVWKNIKVSFLNGYSGSVKYKELDDCYRVYVDIKSNNHKELSGSLYLFYTDKTFLQYFLSPCDAFVHTENGVSSGKLYGFEGNVCLDLQLPFDDATSAADVPVKMTFELPK